MSTNDTKKKPTHRLLHIRKYKVGEEERSSWTRVGIAYTNKDGSIQIVAGVPVILAAGESFQLRDFNEKSKAERDADDEDDIPFN